MRKGVTVASMKRRSEQCTAAAAALRRRTAEVLPRPPSLDFVGSRELFHGATSR